MNSLISVGIRAKSELRRRPHGSERVGFCRVRRVGDGDALRRDTDTGRFTDLVEEIFVLLKCFILIQLARVHLKKNPGRLENESEDGYGNE